ncbi:choice-of-anchor P family protein [Actinophytocola sp. NPDC049390]|uniref:choice-of-anchor P family protein n=1 Tax=Actinophytocola sp. NPDC049390 TaxID=3363894 RepID=UPI0037A9FE39
MTLRRTRMLATGCGLVGVAALAAVLTAPAAAADKGPTGSAYALSVKTTLLDKPLVKIDPRPVAVYPRGGRDSLVEVGPNVAGLVTANVLNASSVLKGRSLVSEASIAEVVVRNILSASIVEAECVAGPSGVSGTSAIADLTVLGQKIDVTVPGEIDVLGIAKVRINEQIRKGGALTVNAVHVIIGGPVGNVTSADIVLSQAKCAWAGGTVPTTTTKPPTTTTTPPGGTTEPPTGTTEPSEPTSGTTSDDAGPSTSTQGFTKTANDDDLAETGASGILPISLAGLTLLAAGGTALVITKRRRAANQD